VKIQWRPYARHSRADGIFIGSLDEYLFEKQTAFSEELYQN